MPIQRCRVKGKTGWRWGHRGKCYPQKAEALRQMRAILDTGWTENARPRQSAELRRNRVLKRDPTRLTTLRRAFIADFSRRFKALKRDLYDLIIRQDAFGLKPRPNPLTGNRAAPDHRFMFHTTPDKVHAFRDWLRQKLQQYFVQDVRQTERQWFERYAEEGYKKGAERAFEYVEGRRWGAGEGDFYEGSKQQFLRSAFGRPVAVEKIQLLAGRVFTELNGISEQMSTKLTRALTDGLVEGKSPIEIARDIAKNVDGIERTRARVLAQTEITRCHAEGQLDALELTGMTHVGVMVEWSTSGLGTTERGYPSPCEECAPLEGVVMTVEEARGLLPRHPGCRCNLLPANVGEDPAEEGQKRSARSIAAAFGESIEAEGGEAPRDKTTWPGADLEPAKERPEKFTVD